MRGHEEAESMQLPVEALGSLPACGLPFPDRCRDLRIAASVSNRDPVLRTILAMRSEMPRDEFQGLCFLLGLLLAFYFLTPFLELTLR